MDCLVDDLGWSFNVVINKFFNYIVRVNVLCMSFKIIDFL